MISADICFSALGEQVEQRVRLSVQLLAAYRISAVLRPWDGTRCSLLVTNANDAYGKRTLDIARSRNTPVLVIGGGATSVPGLGVSSENSPAPAIAHAMRELLRDLVRTDIAAEIATSDAALCRLASDRFRGKAVDASSSGRMVYIRPDEGRVYAQTLSDLLSAIDGFCRSDWTLTLDEGLQETAGHGASLSIEAFLLKAAFAGIGALPRFPDGRHRLTDWPDVGGAPDLLNSLRLARPLLDRASSAANLCSTCAISLEEVNATLWAFAAANLLVTEAEAGAEELALPPARPHGGLMARIARTFGLTLP